MNKSRKGWIWVILIALVLAGAGFFFVRSRAQRVSASSNTLASMETYTLQRTTLDTQVGATGAVRSKQSAQLTFQTAGRVAAVNTQLGSTVKQGDILATLDPASIGASYTQAQIDLINAQQQMDTLMNNATTEAQAQQAVVQAQQAVTDAQNKVDSMKYPRGTDTDVQNLLTKYQLAESQLAQAQDAYDNVKSLPNDDMKKAKALNALTSAQQARDTALANYNWISGKPTQADIDQANANLAVAQSKLADAQRNYDKVKNGPASTDVQVAQERINAAQSTLNTIQLAAPFNGTITSINVMKGDLADPKTVVFRLDDLSNLYVNLQVSEIDVNKVKVGQPVEVTFDAVPDKTYHGVVDSIDQAGTNTQGVVSFNVTVKMQDADGNVHPGITASANITVSSEQGVLAVPSQAIMTTSGTNQSYVLVKSTIANGGVRARQVDVQTGAANDTMTAVTSSQLKEGDEIILNPQSAPTQQRQGLFGGLFRAGGGARFGGGGQGQGQQNGSSGGNNNTAPGSSNSNGGN
jgi:HlyD family secretion protein